MVGISRRNDGRSRPSSASALILPASSGPCTVACVVTASGTSPPDEAGRHLRAAAVGHVQQLDAGLEREPLGGELVDGAGAGRGVGELAGLGLRLRDQLLAPSRRRSPDG